MNKYRLDLGENRQLIERLPGHMRQRVKRAIYALTDNPRPPEAKTLDGEQAGYYRLRIDLYRVIYTIQEEIITVVIVRVAKRDQATYIGLPSLEEIN